MKHWHVTIDVLALFLHGQRKCRHIYHVQHSQWVKNNTAIPFHYTLTTRWDVFSINEGHIYRHSTIMWFQCNSSSWRWRLIELNGVRDRWWAPLGLLLQVTSPRCAGRDSGHPLPFTVAFQCNELYGGTITVICAYLAFRKLWVSQNYHQSQNGMLTHPNASKQMMLSL